VNKVFEYGGQPCTSLLSRDTVDLMQVDSKNLGTDPPSPVLTLTLLGALGISFALEIHPAWRSRRDPPNRNGISVRSLGWPRSLVRVARDVRLH